MQEEEGPRRPGRPARPVTRDHLLKVAREAFSELGYAGASMGDIASRAGIRKSSLFHHFATKDELYKEALEGILKELGMHVAEAIGSEAPFLERMARTSRAVQRYLGGHPVAARLLLREFVDGGTALAAAGDILDTVLKTSATFLEEGMAAGLIQRQDARQLVMSTAGVHLLFFGLPDVSARFFGTDIFAGDQVNARAEAVLSHLQRMYGTSPAQ